MMGSSTNWLALATTLLLSRPICSSVDATRSIRPTSSFPYGIQMVSAPAGCPDEDYSPCNCSVKEAGYAVICDLVPLEVVRGVLKASTTPTLYSLFVLTSESDIPDDLLGGKSTKVLTFVGFHQAFQCRVDAISSTRTVTTSLAMDRWSLSDTNFTILGEFNVLHDIILREVGGLLDSWATLPPLPNLYRLEVMDSVVIGGVNHQCPMLNGSLAEVYFNNDSLDDSTANEIFGCLLLSSKTTVDEIQIGNNKLTGIPPPIMSFTRLRTVKAPGNFVKNITTGSFRFNFGTFPSSAYSSWVDLDSCVIKEIEPGAFVGDYGNTQIYMGSNSLERFESAVFLTVLKQMEPLEKTGFIHVDNNPFDCQTDICHLEWLVVENPSLLDGAVRNARCRNGTWFNDLDTAVIREYCKQTNSMGTTAESITESSTITTYEGASPTDDVIKTTAEPLMTSRISGSSTASCSETTESITWASTTESSSNVSDDEMGIWTSNHHQPSSAGSNQLIQMSYQWFWMILSAVLTSRIFRFHYF